MSNIPKMGQFHKDPLPPALGYREVGFKSQAPHHKPRGGAECCAPQLTIRRGFNRRKKKRLFVAGEHVVLGYNLYRKETSNIP
jgi:hypothetical protein